jgi:hypothetical protein
VTGPDGTAVLERLSGGEWAVEAEDAEGCSFAREVVLVPEIGFAALDLRLEPVPTITGTLRGEDGAPAAGARVSVRGPPFHFQDSRTTVETDAAGRFTLRAASFPPYSRVPLVVWGPWARPGDMLWADPGTPVEATVVRVGLLVRVRDGETKAPAGTVEWSVASPDGKDVAGSTAAGEFTIPKGPCFPRGGTLTVRAAGRAPRTVPLPDPDTGPAILEVDL